MYEYILINIVFAAAIILVLSRFKALCFNKLHFTLLVILIILTAIFDSLIVHFNIVAYDSSKILNLFVGVAPIEDFFYAIIAAILIPAAWRILSRRSNVNAEN